MLSVTQGGSGHVSSHSTACKAVLFALASQLCDLALGAAGVREEAEEEGAHEGAPQAAAEDLGRAVLAHLQRIRHGGSVQLS